MSSPVLLSRDGPVATLTLNRPEALNVLDMAMAEAMLGHATAIAADASVRVVVVRANGKHFMAGGDIRTFAQSLTAAPAAREAQFLHLIERVHITIET